MSHSYPTNDRLTWLRLQRDDCRACVASAEREREREGVRTIRHVLCTLYMLYIHELLIQGKGNVLKLLFKPTSLNQQIVAKSWYHKLTLYFIL